MGRKKRYGEGVVSRMQLYAAQSLRAALVGGVARFLTDSEPRGPWAAPVWVVAPSRDILESLKAWFFEQGPVFGVSFLTPGALRSRLQSQVALLRVAARADQILALHLAAMQLKGIVGLPAFVEHEASVWCRFFETFVSSRAPVSALTEVWMAPLLNAMTTILQSRGLGWVSDIDTGLGEGDLCLKDHTVVALGFEGIHLGFLPLLKAAFKAADSGLMVILHLPKTQEEQLWWGEWEAFCEQEAIVVDEELQAPVIIQVKTDTPTEAVAYGLQVLQHILKIQEPRTVALLIEDPALLRDFAARFEALSVPHHDSLGASGLPHKVKNWLMYQKSGTVAAALEFLRELVCENRVSVTRAQSWEKAWKSACSLLQGEACVLIQALGGKGAEFFEDWPLVSERLTVADFANAMQAACLRLEIDWDAELWANWLSMETLLERQQLAAYSQEALQINSVRGSLGQEPWARIQLLPMHRARSFLAECAIAITSSQPMSSGQPFLGDELMESINRKALTQGSQGEGHVVLRPKTGWVLTHSGLQAHQRGIREDIEAEAVVWKGDNEAEAQPKPKGQYPAIEAAYKARHNEKTSFGPYEYALGGALPHSLSCGQWERVLTVPTQVWYEAILETCVPWESDKESGFAQQRGLWTHEWVQAKVCYGLSAPRWRFIVQARAIQEKLWVGEIYKRCGLSVPTVWTLLWQESLGLAYEFSEKLSKITGFSCVQEEWVLPMKEGSMQGLAVRGRADLVFTENLWNGIDPLTGSAWVVDLKAGRMQAPTTRSMSQGYALQLALYGLKLKAMGATAVHLSLLSPEIHQLKPHVDLETLGEADELWNTLRCFQKRGIFGQKTVPYGVRGRFHPWATLPIADRILEKKQALLKEEINHVS